MGLETQTSSPPLEAKYRDLLEPLKNQEDSLILSAHQHLIQECDLPLIDLQLLKSESINDRERCANHIFSASTEWGFFQIINHGLPPTLLQQMRSHTIDLFSLPFQVKEGQNARHISYIWGTPTVRDLKTANWMEAFHLPLRPGQNTQDTESYNHNAFRLTVEEYGKAMGTIAGEVLQILASKLGLRSSYFNEYYSHTDSFIRINHYPPCPIRWGVYGLESHTDSDLLTLLHQDHVGGLQILKHNHWIAVKPRADTLILNIGDLLQAWSNDVYQSVQHRVTVNNGTERVSIGYFAFPFCDAVIQSPLEDPHYRGFTYTEFKAQVQEDINLIADSFYFPESPLSNLCRHYDEIHLAGVEKFGLHKFSAQYLPIVCRQQSYHIFLRNDSGIGPDA
eukprot:Gb_22752 [translate_table: standard]